MVTRPKLSIEVGGLLALYTYGMTLWNYAPGAGNPGLFGYAPGFALVSVVGILFAFGTFGHVADRSQTVRMVWYPGWTVATSLPLFAVLSLRDAPLGGWVQYPLAVGVAVGFVFEVRSWPR